MSTTDELVRKGQAIIEAAEREGRKLTAAEKAAVSDIVEKGQLQKSVEALGATIGTPGVGSTWGDAFVSAEGYRKLLDGGLPGGPWSAEIVAAAGDPVLKSTGSNADAVPRQVRPGMEDPGLRRERLTLADLFAQAEATGGTIQYMKATTVNDPADTATAEGADKPGAEFAFDDVTLSLSKLAAFIPISEEMLEDAPAVRDFINTTLPLMVEKGLESKLATALYAGAGLTAAPATITGGGNGFDAIFAGINAVQTNDFFEPDGLFIHPNDYAALRIDKDDNGNYLGNGPWAPASAGPWGLRTVVSQSATAGSPIVGAFNAGAVLYRKGGTRLEASNAHSDFFRKNLVAIRAELRYALAIIYSQAFCVVDVTGS